MTPRTRRGIGLCEVAPEFSARSPVGLACGLRAWVRPPAAASRLSRAAVGCASPLPTRRQLQSVRTPVTWTSALPREREAEKDAGPLARTDLPSRQVQSRPLGALSLLVTRHSSDRPAGEHTEVSVRANTERSAERRAQTRRRPLRESSLVVSKAATFPGLW